MPTPQLPHVPVGATGLRVPVLGLGGAPIGNLYATVPEAQALATVRYALEHGLHFIDTAPLYGAGHSERLIGQAVANRPRASFVIATKVGRLVSPEGDISFDFTRSGVLRSLEASLQRLNLAQVDILHLHDADDEGHFKTAMDEAFPALAELRAQGVIKAIGAGMNQWQKPAEFLRHADFNCFLLAGRYTLLEQGGLDFLNTCQSKNVRVFLGGVYNSGILATGPRPGAKYNYTDAPTHILERTGKIEAICQRHHVPLKAAAIQFALAHPAVSAVIGAVTPDEVAENLRMWQTPIPPAVWADLRAAGLLDEAAPLPNPV